MYERAPHPSTSWPICYTTRRSSSRHKSGSSPYASSLRTRESGRPTWKAGFLLPVEPTVWGLSLHELLCRLSTVYEKWFFVIALLRIYVCVTYKCYLVIVLLRMCNVLRVYVTIMYVSCMYLYLSEGVHACMCVCVLYVRAWGCISIRCTYCICFYYVCLKINDCFFFKTWHWHDDEVPRLRQPSFQNYIKISRL